MNNKDCENKADDWNAIQETLFLNAIPGMAESIIEGGNTPLEDCLMEGWELHKFKLNFLSNYGSIYLGLPRW